MGDRTENVREKEGSVSVDFPSISTKEDAPEFGFKLKKGLFWGFAIITFGLPVLILKAYRDFMHIEEEEE